jgi:ribosomal-protein-serine acetyltransferase
MFLQRLNDDHTLRQIALSDAEELYSVCDANRTYLRQWLPWLDRTRQVADTRGFIEGAIRQSEANQGFQAVILVGGQIVGLVGFHRIDWANHSTSLGYWLAEDYQGCGLVTAGCRALIDHGFAALNLHRIVIACAPANTRSRAIPERLGFVHEGRLRDAEWLYDHYVDHEIYAQLQSEWQTQIIAQLSGKGILNGPA